MNNCVSHFMPLRHSTAVPYEKLPLCPHAWWLVPAMHETTLRKGGVRGWERIWLGQWSWLSAIDKGWFLLRAQAFQHVCTVTGSPRTKRKKYIFWGWETWDFRTTAGKNVHYCQFLFDKLDLSFCCTPTWLSMYANTSTLYLEKSNTSVERYGNIQTPFSVPTMGQNLFDSFVVFSQQSDRKIAWLLFFLLTQSDCI